MILLMKDKAEIIVCTGGTYFIKWTFTSYSSTCKFNDPSAE